MNIEHIIEGNKGCFNFMDNDEMAGQMTYSKAGEDKIIIDHTHVIPAYNGKGIGKILVMEAVKYARENKIKIMPLCPFANAVFQKDKDIQDVLF